MGTGDHWAEHTFQTPRLQDEEDKVENDLEMQTENIQHIKIVWVIFAEIREKEACSMFGSIHGSQKEAASRVKKQDVENLAKTGIRNK